MTEKKAGKIMYTTARDARLTPEDKAVYFFTVLKFSKEQNISVSVLKDFIEEEKLLSSLGQLQKCGYIEIDGGGFISLKLDKRKNK